MNCKAEMSRDNNCQRVVAFWDNFQGIGGVVKLICNNHDSTHNFGQIHQKLVILFLKTAPKYSLKKSFLQHPLRKKLGGKGVAFKPISLGSYVAKSGKKFLKNDDSNDLLLRAKSHFLLGSVFNNRCCCCCCCCRCFDNSRRSDPPDSRTFFGSFVTSGWLWWSCCCCCCDVISGRLSKLGRLPPRQHPATCFIFGQSFLFSKEKINCSLQ